MKKEIRKILKRIACIALLSGLAGAELKAQQDKVVSNYSNESEISAPGSVTLKAGFYIPSGNTVRIYTTGISYIKCIPSIGSPSIKQNYVSTRIFKMAGVNSVNLDSARSTCEVNQAIQYFDGLGRPLQVVGVQESPQGQDLVQPFAYDAFGKESIRYLPYAAASNGGAYRLDALQANLGQQAFYNSPPAGISNISSPFSKTVIEASPLNRVTEQGAPGSPWQPVPGSTAGHTAKIDYGTNIKDEVKLWKINTSDNGATATVYEPGSLSKITSKDENWKIENGKEGTVEEFQDSRGLVVLKRVWETDNKSLSTCYVYDDLGNLRYVLPSAVNENGQNLINSFDESQTVFSQFIYGYHYDGRKRLVEKKIPGKGWEYIVYNKLNQVVASQDAIQRAKVNQDWTINKYDFLGRVILTGVYTYPSSSAGTSYRSILQSTIDAQPITVSLWENRVSTGNGYTNQCWPTTGITTTLTVNYYDDYTIPGLPVASPYNLASSYNNKVNLLPTASLVNVLGTSQMLWKVNYYDDRGRPVRGIQQHYKGAATTTNNYDDVISTYSFSNELLTSTRRHYVNGVEQLYVASRFTYDAQGRAIDIYQKTGDNISTPNAEILLSRKSYNEIGQLTSKQLYSANTSTPAFAQTVTYSYNARGWLKSQSAPLFTQILKYEDAVTGVTPQYNGNISRQEWGIGKYYNYTYDKLSRLNSAVSEDNNNELMGYDAMGNITRLQRKQTGALVDQLKYTYTPGNQLSSVWDSNTVNTSAVF
nr:DUF6443 domain-containing protein [Pedobacter sp. ASV19]